MASVTCTVDNQGRVMLPVDWRRRFNIGPSTKLVVTEDETGALIVETHEQGLQRAQLLVSRYLQPGQKSLSEQLSEDRRKEADSEQ
jgi:AbrB family looped-hinge helix DNA binding protein